MKGKPTSIDGFALPIDVDLSPVLGGAIGGALGAMGGFGAGMLKIKFTENLTSRFLTAAQRIPGETLRSASRSILQGCVANVVNSYPDILYSLGLSLAEERGFI